MNRDPFDSLRDRNPVPPEHLPDAPMQVASAITAGRSSLRRGLAVAAAAAALVLVGGGSWLLWSRTGGREMAGGVGTTAAPDGTTVSAAGASSEGSIAVVYFLDADTSTLVPVARDLGVLNVRPLPDPGPLTVELLLRGPGAWDAAPLPDPVAAAEAALATAIPADATLLTLSVGADGIAYLDLSAAFADASHEALAQVVFTATRLEGVGAVRFLVEGEPQYLAAETLALVPAAVFPAEAMPIDPVTRGAFAALRPLVLIESPALGDTLALPETISGTAVPADGEIRLRLVAEDGTLAWEGTAPATCPGCPAGAFSLEIPASFAGGTGWFSLRAYLADDDRAPLAEYPVWVVPYLPSAEEPAIPEATTTSTTIPGTTTSTISAPAAPWSAEALPSAAVPEAARSTWSAADNRDACALLFPTDPDALAQGAVLHDRYFGGGWGLAWDLSSGPGRWEPGGEYCADCGREEFGVAGTGGQALGNEDAIWPHRLTWADGSHAGYGYEGLSAGASGEPLLAYLFVEGEDCMYNVWSFLGEERLLGLIDQLRFVEGLGTP